MMGRHVDAGISFGARAVDSGIARPRAAARVRTATVCGSLRRARDEMEAARTALDGMGVRVLSPPSFSVDSPGRGFARLQGDPSKEVRATEDRHLDAICNSDLVWLSAPDGKVGVSASFEVGYSKACGINVFTADRLADVMLSSYVAHAATMSRAVARAASGGAHYGTTLLLQPKEAIARIRAELDGLERTLHAEDRPMNALESARARAAAQRIVRLLGNLARPGVE